MPLDDRLGIRFREIMSGRIQRTGDTGPGETFKFDLNIHIPSLNRFRRDRPRVALIEGGLVTWGQHSAPAAGDGRMELFNPYDAARTRKYFLSGFRFTDADGVEVAVTTRKELVDDGFLDYAGDLSTMSATLRKQGAEVASGTVRAAFGDLLKQLTSITVVGDPPPSGDEERAVRDSFFGFMNTELREIYDDLPELFTDAGALSWEEERTLRLIARVMLPDPLPANGPQLPDVIDQLDRFLLDASADQITSLRGLLHTFSGFAPLAGGDVPKIREFVRRTLSRPERSGIRDTLDTLQALLSLPYYSHPAVDAMLGYQRPVPANESPRPGGSSTLTPLVRAPDREFDVVVIGSGPSGSLVAARLASAGKSVLILEAGPYVREESIPTDELVSVAKLYKQSGFQIANDGTDSDYGPPCRVLQGSCVGGGGLVNNAVCLPLPDFRFAAWQARGFPIARSSLDESYRKVKQDLGITNLSAAMNAGRVTRRNPTGDFLTAAWGAVQPIADVTVPAAPGLYECPVNLGDCLGLGLCNVGCPSARKNNPLQVYLKQAQDNGAQLVHRAQVMRLDVKRKNGTMQVTGATVRLGTGETQSVRAKRYVLAAGPIGTTAVILRSEELRLALLFAGVPVGEGFSANIGSPVFAFCTTTVHVQPSVQIAHYYVPPTPQDGFVVETWYNPPAANALAMPGVLETLWARMSRYASTIAAAPLVGTRREGRVRLEGDQVKIDLPVGQPELAALRRGLVAVASAFAGNPKIEKAVVALDTGVEVSTPQHIADLDQQLKGLEQNPKQAFRLRFGTGHPQGGSALSEDPMIGVVGADFLVRGTENLYVADGSLFPDVAGVNPQWTIMALADQCAGNMLAF